MSAALADVAWTDVERRGPGGVLVVPLGATEQHGPHLPLATDSAIAVALAGAAAERLPEVCVAPLLPYGASGEHAGFAGTISIGQEATELVLVELCRSAGGSFDRILLLCAHGGNAGPLRRAVELLRGEGREVRGWMPRWDGDAHAGRTETSLMLAIDPARVRAESAEPGNTAPLAELLRELREDGVRALAPNGVLGDPGGATAAEGRELLAAAVADLVATIAAWDEGAPA